MGKSFKKLKDEIHELKNQLDVKNNRIAVLLLAMSALEDKVAKLSKKRVFKVKFRTTDKEKVTHRAIDGTEFDTLSEAVEHNEDLPNIECSGSIKEKMVESDTAFSSRFMPNVKFVLDPSIEEQSNIIGKGKGLVYVNTTEDGSLEIMSYDSEWFYNLAVPHVSRFVAAPELVPEGMVYDKKSDSLIEKLLNIKKVYVGYFDEVDFINEQIKQDPEKFESFLAKWSFRCK